MEVTVVLSMVDEKGPDSKVLCVALGDPSVGEFVSIGEVAPRLIEEVQHFFSVYKELEHGKPVHVADWSGAAAAEQLIVEYRNRAISLKQEKDHQMKLEMSDTQADVLREILDAAYRDLKYEIASTDNSRFKVDLRSREDVLESLLNAVGGPLPDRS